MDPIKFLMQQHRRVEALFERYQRMPSKRAEIAGLIERAIIPHAIIEEMYVYPLIRERVPEGEKLSEHSVEEHAEVEEALKRLHSMSPESAAYDNEMRKIIDSVQHHVHEEEEDPGTLQMLRKALMKKELDELGRALKRAYDVAPTRAHPLAPDHPPLNRILGPVTSVIDRVRDRLDGRAELEEQGMSALRGPRRSRGRSQRRRASSSRKRSSGTGKRRQAARSGTRSGGTQARAASRTTQGRSSRSSGRGASNGSASRATSRRRSTSRGKSAARRQTRMAGKARRR